MSKILDLARKIKRLAEQGVGGEKLNAEKMLADLCAKHGISVAEIEGEAVTRYLFPSTKLTDHLLDQIIWKVCGTKATIYSPAGRRHGSAVVCTEAQRLEILALYGIYSRALAKAVEDVKTAFIHANNIFPSGEDDDDQKEKPARTPEQLAEDRRIAALANSIEATPIYKTLRNGR